MHASWLNRLLRDNKGVRYFVIALVLIIAVGAGVVTILLRNRPVTTTPAKIIKVKPVPKAASKYYSALTGLEVSDQTAIIAPVTAVMIENSPDARPQSGLKGAGVVFEAIAEGGITRFVAIFQGPKPALIGPVRSVRPYFVSWFAPFDASIAHVGGSALALQQVRDGTYRDEDQFFNAATYWRSTDRYAPHNVYTSGANLDTLNAKKGYTTSTFTGFTRIAAGVADLQKPQGAPATSIKVSISISLYDPSYTYEPATKTYPRSINGGPQIDREAGQLAPSVVIVMKVPTSVVMQDGYREQMDVIGKGDATIFQRGQVFEGTWSKTAQRDQLTFTDSAGNEIPLERGQTWITAIPSQNSVNYQ
jgi:hypothetical protein